MSPANAPPAQVSDYTVLPLRQPRLSTNPAPATHYLYLRPHQPKIPHPDSLRSLFLVNVPVDATLLGLRAVFVDQLGGGRLEHVDFEGAPTSRKQHGVPSAAPSGGSKNRKRKRAASDAQHDPVPALPETWDRDLYGSGSTAVAVFADRPSMELAYKAARKAARARTEIVWEAGLDERLPGLGSQRYLRHHELRYPSKDSLQSAVDVYTTSFAAAEAARARLVARQRQVPDAEGFVTVTRGGRTGPARLQEAHDKMEELRQKEEGKRAGMGDFYRFQVRERRKTEAGQLVKRFEEDRRKVDEMRRQRGNRFKPA